MKILIADDDATSRMLLEAILKKWDFECIVTEDGEAAWAVMQEKNPPSFLFVDWEMPKINGIDLIKLIRLQHTSTPPYIILVTARSDTLDIVAGLDSGANDYIIKPFDSTELKARTNAGMRVLRLQKDLYRAQSHLKKERLVIENIINKMHSSHEPNMRNIRYLSQPVETISGDVFFSADTPLGVQHIFLGDFTGHGLIAAIAGPTASDIFYSLTAKGLPAQKIIRKINTSMFQKLPRGLFLTAIFLEINAARNEVNIWNCGMESVFHFNNNELTNKVVSANLPLGITDDFSQDPVNLSLKQGDKLYAYTDGITETMDNDGVQFGQKNLINSINDMLLKHAEIDTLLSIIEHYRCGGVQMDDLSLLEITP
jgi:serine phosphatase RsbU (regulator of sigma subunit)